MTLQQEYQERFQEGKEEGWREGRHEGKIEGRREGKIEGQREGKIEGKIELLAHDFDLTVPEIAEKLSLSKDEVQRILDHLQ